VLATESTVNLKCPIQGSLMEDPVKNKRCGHVYSKLAIYQHIKIDRKCPVWLGAAIMRLKSNISNRIWKRSTWSVAKRFDKSTLRFSRVKMLLMQMTMRKRISFKRTLCNSFLSNHLLAFVSNTYVLAQGVSETGWYVYLPDTMTGLNDIASAAQITIDKQVPAII